ncbi:molybdopterin synthase catalytic subunit MoaE [Crenobacter cavernae]|uniref:Molybdopterin synthase catalytic subunit n=1 Tax=Crenobacter cavernae TaxID=2290923 RepID=A0A345Y4P7_9NEIS|nr:molybdopterin synthase catalytic subunit MoaE [Crenobacter cavernae]AXK38899.1 molybdopterin synthase catalytic subunit MoaE [Crenobacter cavernae]
MERYTVAVQTKAFDAGAELARLSADPAVGALVSFTGLVRDYGDTTGVAALELEHYPGMTEKALMAIVDDARARWPLSAATVVHRVGRLALGDAIVLVVVAASHRRDAFAAAEYLMDYLKTRAPFWKKEIGRDGTAHWVEAKASDEAAAGRWTGEES